MIVIVVKYLIPKKYRGLTLFPFVFLTQEKDKENKVLLNHESIHIQQQKELLVIPFYVIYSLEFLIRLAQFRNWDLAYRNISFEREAYKNEKDLNYLEKRSFLKSFKFF